MYHEAGDLAGQHCKSMLVFPALIHVLVVMCLSSDSFCTYGLASSSIRCAPVYHRSFLVSCPFPPPMPFCGNYSLSWLSWLVLTPWHGSTRILYFHPSGTPSVFTSFAVLCLCYCVNCVIMFDHHVGYSVSLCRQFAYLFPLVFGFRE